MVCHCLGEKKADHACGVLGSGGGDGGGLIDNANTRGEKKLVRVRVRIILCMYTYTNIRYTYAVYVYTVYIIYIIQVYTTYGGREEGKRKKKKRKEEKSVFKSVCVCARVCVRERERKKKNCKIWLARRDREGCAGSMVVVAAVESMSSARYSAADACVCTC